MNNPGIFLLSRPSSSYSLRAHGPLVFPVATTVRTPNSAASRSASAVLSLNRCFESNSVPSTSVTINLTSYSTPSFASTRAGSLERRRRAALERAAEPVPSAAFAASTAVRARVRRLSGPAPRSSSARSDAFAVASRRARRVARCARTPGRPAAFRTPTRHARVATRAVADVASMVALERARALPTARARVWRFGRVDSVERFSKKFCGRRRLRGDRRGMVF